MERRATVVFVLAVLLVGAIGADMSALGIELSAEKYYTWGISGDDVHIASGRVITEALLRIHGITSITENTADSLVLSVLDNPPLGFVGNWHVEGIDPFTQHGCRLLPIYHDTVRNAQEVTFRFSEINDDTSWTWRIFDPPFEVQLADSTSVSYSSSLLELIDYAGNGTPFGIGLDPDSADDFTFMGISLELTVSSFEGDPNQSLLIFSYGDINRAPVFESLADRVVAENVELSFAVEAEDPEGDDVTCSVQNLPAGAAFENGVFRWTPSYDFASRGSTRVCRVTFIADDGRVSSSQTVAITVSNSNRTPVLAPIAAMEVGENTELSFTLSATDPDGDEINYIEYGLPRGAVFDEGKFVWRPDYDQAGLYFLLFGAGDGLATDFVSVRIRVKNTNRSPVLASISDKEVGENMELSFTLSATDPDGDEINYIEYGLPRGAVFDDGKFVWRPDYDQAGLYFLLFGAGDGLATDFVSVRIWVKNTNRAPILASISDKEVGENMELSFAVSATDPDGDEIEYSVYALPAGAKFEKGTFSWRPDYGQAGIYHVLFVAGDGVLVGLAATRIQVNSM